MRRASALLERLAAPPVRATQERYRHELKYLINEGEHAALACRMAPVFKLDKHARAGGYTIRSLYFDDYDDRCLLENENGTDPREKFRIRIYNGSAERISLEEVLRALPEQDQQLIRLRFYGNKTQSETAKVLHTTQVQISRRERRILSLLRRRLLED